METMTIEELKNKFLETATLYGNAILVGEHKVANRLHGKLMKIYQDANQNNASSLFEAFLDNKNDSISLWSSTFLLRSRPELAIKTLKELSLKPTIFATTARITLDLWNKGKLELL